MRVKLRAREHLDLVLLAGLRDGPCTGAELADGVARRSGGRIPLDPRAVHCALHRLRRNRMVTADDAHRYRLSEAGERSLGAREREWTAFVDAVELMFAPPDDGRPAVRATAQERARSSSSCS